MVCDTPLEVTKQVDVLFTSLPDDSMLAQVASAPAEVSAMPSYGYSLMCELYDPNELGADWVHPGCRPPTPGAVRPGIGRLRS